MAELVPGRGASLSELVGVNTARATALGPFPVGTYIEQINAQMKFHAGDGVSGIQIGFGLTGNTEITLGAFLASEKLWYPGVSGGGQPGTRQYLAFAEMIHPLIIHVGVFIVSGPKYVLCFHDLADGTAVCGYDVSVKTLRTVRRIPLIE